MANTGSELLSILATSIPYLSLLTLLKHAFNSSEDDVFNNSLSKWKPNLEAKRIARNTLKGSSKKVDKGGSGVRIKPFFKSSNP